MVDIRDISGAKAKKKARPSGVAVDERFEYANAQAEDAIDWYYKAKYWKRFQSWTYRGATIVLTAAGGLLPIAGTMVSGVQREPGAALALWEQVTTWNLCGALCIGLGALALALDRFSGSSTGWMRYIGAAMTLETLVEELRTDWTKLQFEANPTTSSEHTAKCLDRLGVFVLAVRKIVEGETQAWVREFQENLSQLEEETKEAWNAAREQAKKEAAEVTKQAKELADAQLQARNETLPGAIEVTVKSSVDLVGGYSVAIKDHGASGETTGPVCGVGGIAPGLREVVVTAKTAASPVRASKVVRVKPNDVTPVEIDLG